MSEAAAGPAVAPAPVAAAPQRYWLLAQEVVAERDRRFKRAVTVTMLLALLAAFAAGASVIPVASVVDDLPQAMLLFLVFAGITLAFLLIRATGGSYRQALVVGEFARSTSFRRWQESTGEPAPPMTPDAAAAWLARHPDETDLPERRVHALINVGDLPGARRALDHYPGDTPRQRFALVADRAFLDFLEGRDFDPEAARPEAGAIEEPADRAMAVATIAVAHAYRAAAAGGDWIAPMAAAYPEVAPHATTAESWRLPYVVQMWTLTMVVVAALVGAYLLVTRWLGVWGA